MNRTETGQGGGLPWPRQGKDKNDVDQKDNREKEEIVLTGCAFCSRFYCPIPGDVGAQPQVERSPFDVF